MEPWRRLPTHVGASDLHFALSDALVRRSPMPTLWWHATERPTLIVGAGQGALDLPACERAGVLVVRRQTGGTAVYAAPGVLGLDVMLPPGHPLAPSDIVETYRWLGETWTSALTSLGVDARLVSLPEARAAHLHDGDGEIRLACFGTLSPYEVTAGGRKLVGLAQVRRRTGVLLQSAIHRHFDAEAIGRLLSGSRNLVERLQAVAVGLDELLPEPPDVEEVVRCFEDVLIARHNVELTEGAWRPDELELAGTSWKRLEAGVREGPIHLGR